MKTFNRIIRTAACAGVAAVALVPAMAWAQEEAGAQADAAADEGEEIVVTGTILRGAPPVGSSLISVDQTRAQAQGATTSNELLATIPQVSNLFNNVPTSRLSVAVNQIQVVRPNLRNLAAEGSSSSSTLVLFDGHRIAPVGVTQNAVDPDLIPGLAIERVEVVTDGGSATYGSDAVGGVINFVTRKRFDGVKVQARYGFADDYYQVDAGAIVGKDWGSGSLFAAYNYQHNNSLFGRDRDWVRDVDWHTTGLAPFGTPRGRSCPNTSNVQFNVNNVATMFAYPSLAPGANVCDPTDDQSIVPESTRHGAIAGLHQELSDWLTVDVRAFYGSRKSISYSPFRGSATVTGGSNGNNPKQFYYIPVPGQNSTINQTVFYSFAPLLGTNSATARSEFSEWGANAEFKAELSSNWQLRTLFNYSNSSSNFHIQRINTTRAGTYGRGTTAGTAINYYNPTAADLPLIMDLIDNEEAGEGKEELFNVRAIVDGTLLTLPGGDVKVAVGYEYMHDRFGKRKVTDVRLNQLALQPFVNYNRSVNSLFGEVQIPIFGEDNAVPGINSLVLAGSVRYDHFSDFGSTVNPKIGLNYKPIPWLTFRGNYSTSFNAPSPNDQLSSIGNVPTIDPRNQNAPFVKPGDTNITVNGLISVQGTVAGLRPQTASIWSLGFDVEPPFIEGLRASATYYNVKFKDIIRQPSPNNQIYANFPSAIASNVNGFTLAEITDIIQNWAGVDSTAFLDASGPIAQRCLAQAGCGIYAVIDFRAANYGRVDVQGLDFSTTYRKTTSFGGIDLGFSGNYVFSRKSQTGIGAPIIDELQAYVLNVPTGSGTILLPNNASSRFSFQAMVGADIGSFRAQATLNHTEGFDVVRCDPTTVPVCNPSTTWAPTSSGTLQDHVGSFNTVNLFFKYSVPSESKLLKDLDLTLNINNVFDQDPPLYTSIGSSTPGYANGFTLGRLVQVGLSKKF